MKRAALVISIALVVLSGPALGLLAQAQEEDLSAGREWGLGARFLPQGLMPLAPGEVDPALTTAITLKYWTKGALGFEAGGWFSSYTDLWSSRSLTSLSGGVLFKLSDNPRADFYLAGRAISLNSFRKDDIICREPLREPGSSPSAEDEPVPPPWPCWPASSEGRSATLAVSLAAGLEWSRAREVATSFEVGLVYAQTVSTTSYFPPPEGEPIPLPQPEQETFVSSSLGITLSLTLTFYFPRGS
jgi:hypothetical protein